MIKIGSCPVPAILCLVLWSYTINTVLIRFLVYYKILIYINCILVIWQIDVIHKSERNMLVKNYDM
jgi:hypothetical protein